MVHRFQVRSPRANPVSSVFSGKSWTSTQDLWSVSAQRATPTGRQALCPQELPKSLVCDWTKAQEGIIVGTGQ